MAREFAQFLQQALLRQCWSYSELAARSGLHVSLISRVARGEREPTINFIRRTAQALGAPVSEALAAAGLFSEALNLSEGREAAVLSPYVQYAATPEGEEEIATRLSAKLERVRCQPDPGGKIALLLDWVGLLAARFQTSQGAVRAVIGGALLYFLSPVDLVPDFIPIAGLMDDLSVLALVLRLIAVREEPKAAGK